MIYSTVTSKGTTTIPAALRHKYGIRAGDVVGYDENPDTGEIVIKKASSIAEIHALNAAVMRRTGASFKNYKSGDGFRAHVKQKHGAGN